MKELVVISGKGGTGKTSLVASFAAIEKRVILADCDVDAANLHLLLEPRPIEKKEFRAGHVAMIGKDFCNRCGTCYTLCRFEAVLKETEGSGEASYAVDPVACEGCGVCSDHCPEHAIDFSERLSGEWFVSQTRLGILVHARLGIAAENSGKLVFRIREKARELAGSRGEDLVIVDGSPGVGCPVIASVTGSDLVLAVTEPTRSGLHDLKRVADLTEHFKLPLAVLINKADLNESMTRSIEAWCRERGIEVVGGIPYTSLFTEAMTRCRTVVETDRNGAEIRAIGSAWKRVKAILHEEKMGDGYER